MTTPAKPRPLAVVDIGSNSARLIVVRIDRGRHLEILSGMRVPLRLAREVEPGGRLTPDAITRTVAAMEDFRAIAASAGAQRTVAVATAAVRDASNPDELVSAVARATGIRVRVIDGAEEANYAFLGAVHGLPVENGVMIDVGGGSAEISQFAGRRMKRSWTLPVGSLRVTRQFIDSDPPSPKEIKALTEHVAAAIEGVGLPRLPGGESLIGTGGTVRNLARLTQRRDNSAIVRVHGSIVPARAVSDTVHALVGRKTAERAAMSGVKADRADSIVGGALVVDSIMRALGARSLVVAGQGLREGLAYSELGIATQEPSEVRSASVLALTARFSTWSATAAERRLEIVQSLLAALAPYDENPEVVEMLCHGSTLLDIGRSIDYWDRFIHTAAIVADADLVGFSHRSLAILSALVRRAGDGSFAYKTFGTLLREEDRPFIERAAVLLALADDVERRSPRNAAARISCSVGEDAVAVATPVAGGWWSEAMAQRFRRAFAKELLLTTIS